MFSQLHVDLVLFSNHALSGNYIIFDFLEIKKVDTQIRHMYIIVIRNPYVHGHPE